MVLLLNLGQVLRDQNRLDLAEAVLQESLGMAVARAEKYIQAQCHSDLARTWLMAGKHEEAIAASQAAIDLLAELDLSAAMSADLATQAQAALEMGHRDVALALAHQILTLLDADQGEGADFPQRDYWVAYCVLAELGDSGASHALEQSRLHLTRMGDRFKDAEMRHAFLHNIETNRAIASSF
jgi:tetratricopeptide (TPR) repeat protein